MNSCSDMTTLNFTHHNTVQGSVVVPMHRQVPLFYVGTHRGPWGWQWGGGIRGLISVPLPVTSTTIKVLMDDIEKDAPGMYRTVTDLTYSRSPECPFIVDEPSMASFRSCLYKYENEKTSLSPDAQIGVRKSIAAALGRRKGLISDEEVCSVDYPCSVDIESLVDSLCGPRLPPQDFSIDEHDRGTMSMDLGTEDDGPQTPLETPSLWDVVRSKVCEEVAGADRVDNSFSRNM